MADGTRTGGTAAPAGTGDVPPYTIPYLTLRGPAGALSEPVPRADVIELLEREFRLPRRRRLG